VTVAYLPYYNLRDHFVPRRVRIGFSSRPPVAGVSHAGVFSRGRAPSLTAGTAVRTLDSAQAWGGPGTETLQFLKQYCRIFHASISGEGGNGR
jgi:hypothetical protein